MFNYISKLELFFRWISRVWSVLSLVFLTFMVSAHLLGGEFGLFNSVQEAIMFCFFPIGTSFGMICAWKNERLGGAITTVSIITFHLIGKQYSLNLWIDGLSAPGLFFIITWKISKFTSLPK